MKTSVTFQPKGKVVSVNKGEILLQTALKNRVYINNRCGGKGSCTTCKIQILSDQDGVSFPSPREKRLLSEEDLAVGIRLACQTRVFERCEVSIIENTWKSIVNRNRSSKQSVEEETEE
ncbi:hypothetical protein BEP19_01755 [Ammoniphilus oxalaticus]|uniref:2Fe-2S ferredoxin-type domain-containing protein n=1 Tax=Ammoniphilus oxalaticus TaxID=66863 RepID=A0A419SN98_9BACL|nr:2Fe-2S iron-sulfur cluster-binding protein [Ammoniphilus oxalaticus]RKD25691.1 hypothetical protein BEP19_01755 [Ammoniphilus oxalaticus]